MLTKNKPFLALTAADLMTAPVVMVPQYMSLQGAARVLARAHVTGAPVVDSGGRCIGVLSATDIVGWAGDSKRPQMSDSWPDIYEASQMVGEEEVPEILVREYMTRSLVTVPADIRIGELSRIMLEAHIHRVIVVDENRHPVGVVSSTDVLAAVAHAAAAETMDHEKPCYQ